MPPDDNGRLIRDLLADTTSAQRETATAIEGIRGDVRSLGEKVLRLESAVQNATKASEACVAERVLSRESEDNERTQIVNARQTWVRWTENVASASASAVTQIANMQPVKWGIGLLFVGFVVYVLSWLGALDYMAPHLQGMLKGAGVP